MTPQQASLAYIPESDLRAEIQRRKARSRRRSVWDPRKIVISWALMGLIACAGSAATQIASTTPIAPMLKPAAAASTDIGTQIKTDVQKQLDATGAIRAFPNLPPLAVPQVQVVEDAAGRIKAQADRLSAEVTAPVLAAATAAEAKEKQIQALTEAEAKAEKALADEKESNRVWIKHMLGWASLLGFGAAAAFAAWGAFGGGIKAFGVAGACAVLAGCLAAFSLFLVQIAVGCLIAMGLCIVGGAVWFIIDYRQKHNAVVQVGQLTEDVKGDLRVAAPAKATAIFGAPGSSGYGSIPNWLDDATIDLIDKLRKNGAIKTATAVSPTPTPAVYNPVYNPPTIAVGL